MGTRAFPKVVCAVQVLGLVVLLSACAATGDEYSPAGPGRQAGGPIIGSNVLAAPHGQVPIAAPDTTKSNVGHWYLDRDSARFSLTMSASGNQLVGQLSLEETPEDATPVTVWDLDAGRGHLQLRAREKDEWVWYDLETNDGVLAGRYARSSDGQSPPPLGSAYAGHVIGWRSESFEKDIVPRVFDIVTNDEEHAKLRIDRSAENPSEYVGELKVYATESAWTDAEQPMRNVLVTNWDGHHLAFDVASRAGHQLFTGDVTGRTIAGSVLVPSGDVQPFRGVRADVLTYGLSGKTVAERREWQEATRRRFFRLMMAGNPLPMASTVKVGDPVEPPSGPIPSNRDDDAAKWDRDYTLQEVMFTYQLPNRYGGAPLTRQAHGYLSTPKAAPPPGGYGLALAVNGHWGSGWQAFKPDTIFWYGDGFARRGYVVLGLDVSHRPPSDTGGLYDDVPEGDDPSAGNGPHPAIAAPGLDSDWTEMGERAWDAMRGIDFLLSLANGNASSLVVTGLSMGGELTDLVSALDPRVRVAAPACAPTDLSLLRWHGGHVCWEWTHGDAAEFFDISDQLAMTAPRPVVRQTGKLDWLYSSIWPYYVSEKEVVRRGRVAYSEDPAALVHYIHDDAHTFHAGDVSDTDSEPVGIQAPAMGGPMSWTDESIDWSVDERTVSLHQTLFDRVASVWRGSRQYEPDFH